MIGPGGDGGETSSSTRNRRRRPEPSPLQRALGLLTRREHSRKELTRKLTQRGVDAHEASAVVGKLTEAGWQDDTRFAETLLRSRAASGYGPSWIRAELATHGVGEEAMDHALAEFPEDWVAIACRLLQRRFGVIVPADLMRRRKALDLLLRRGFAMDQARLALARASEGD